MRTLPAILLTVFAISALAAPATLPSTSAAVEHLTIRLTAVQGMVQFRAGDDQPWQAAKTGMVLGEGVELRTGPRSAVQFAIPPDQTVTLDRLGTIRVLELVRGGGKVKTDLGMKYGRTQYEIEAAGEAHESVIRSPNSALAVRGTRVILYDQPPYNVEVVSLTGRANFKNQAGRQIAFGGAQKTTISADQNSAAATALSATALDASERLARSASETSAVLALPAQAGNTNQSLGLDQVRAGASSALANITNPTRSVGQLDFTLTWRGNANLDLAVLSPLGELLVANPAADQFPGHPTGATSVASGGRIAHDDTGHANAGRELAIWPTSYPPGEFTFATNYISGKTPATFRIDVTLNGQPAASPLIGTIDPTLGNPGLVGTKATIGK